MSKASSYLFKSKLVVLISLALSACTSAPDQSNLSYQAKAQVYDWGASINKVVLNLGNPLPYQAINPDTFEVKVQRYDQRLDKPLFAQGQRQVLKAYLSDQDGNPTQMASQYVSLELAVSPENTLAQVLNYDQGYNQWAENNYQIKQQTPIQGVSGEIKGLAINQKQATDVDLLDQFKFDAYKGSEHQLMYASYSPIADDHKNPMIIWLHGGGEGGNDPRLPLIANKAIKLASPEMQNYFQGAYLLMPQAPTRWMDGFKSKSDGSSIYEQDLIQLIKTYVAKNPDIDPNKIYLGGASNGGYMTMLLLRDEPKYFAAAFPICEGLNDDLISDQDLENIAQTPTWFIAAKDDHSLPVLDNTLPTYIRLLQNGSRDAQLSLYDHVFDTSGLYKDEAGNPYQYNGHWSWIYAFNNEVHTKIDAKEYSLMAWMAAQSR